MNIKYEDQRSLEDCLAYLQQLTEGIRVGAVDISCKQKQVTLRPTGALECKVVAWQKGDAEGIKLEFDWPRESKATRPMQILSGNDSAGEISKPNAPAAVSSAEAEPKEVDAELDGPDSEPVTLRQPRKAERAAS